jgi:hypothetical protein
MEPTLQCERCGNEFTPKKWWAHFCSLECRNGYWSHLRKLERQDKREVRDLSRQLAIRELAREGLPVESMTTRKINIAADQYLAAHPELVEEAAKRLITADLKEVNGLRAHVDGNAIVSAIKYGRPVEAAPPEPLKRRRLDGTQIVEALKLRTAQG